MSKLQMNPEFDAVETLERPLDAAGAAGAAAFGDQARAGSLRTRGARRSRGAAQLRLPSDDGFHLFRVY